jgi:hypothetical protein
LRDPIPGYHPKNQTGVMFFAGDKDKFHVNVFIVGHSSQFANKIKQGQQLNFENGLIKIEGRAFKYTVTFNVSILR